MTAVIRVKRAKTHNLKDVSVDIPLKKLVAIVGPSGGGKSSLAYDVVFRAAQGQPVEASVTGLPKRVLALGQKVRPPKDAAMSLGEYHLRAMREVFGQLRPGDGLVIDEPCAGRTKEEARAILRELRGLVRHGISVLAVEHSKELIRGADYVLELGPQSGAAGGRVVFQGTLAAFRRSDTSTAKHVFSAAAARVNYRRQPNERAARMRRQTLSVRHITRHGLPDLAVSFPLASLVCLCGGRGAGKTTVLDVIYRKLFKGHGAWKLRTADIAGTQVVGKQNVRRSYFVDQSPLSGQARSRVATYLGIWDAIRGFYAALPESRKLGLTKTDFNAASVGPRTGRRQVDKAISRVTYAGRTSQEILAMTVMEAAGLFRDVSLIRRKLGFLEEVGLGYLQLGQLTGTLSGGEAQRMRLAKILSKRLGDRCVYLLDTPTRGLHLSDLPALIAVFQKIIDKNNTVVVADNRDELIANSDCVLRLG